MKKIKLFALVMLVMGVVLTGCSNDKKEVSGASKVTNEKVSSVPTKKVFVSPQWVKSVIDGKQKESKNYVIVETGWGDVKDNPNYQKEHLPGAVYADISQLEEEPYWNIKKPEDIKKSILDLGINKDSVVILNGPDLLGTSRAAFIYLWAGVNNVKILDGGLDAWKQDGYEVEKKVNEPKKETDFKTKVPAHPEYVIKMNDVAKRLDSDKNFNLVSIRSYDEFSGKTSGYNYINKAGEPKGAIWGKAGSDSYHMEDYLNKDGKVLNIEELKQLWKSTKVDINKDLAFYCGTGWRATLPFLIMYENNYHNMQVYDGGWIEWQASKLPVQVGDPNKGDVKYLNADKIK